MNKIPHYQELSLKNLYPDVIKDEQVSMYLPNLETNSGQLPERIFFFTILGTIKNEYLRSMIDHAHQVRYNEGAQSEEANGIEIKNDWFD